MVWTVLGDSVTGTSHHARSTPCQDAFRFCRFGSMAEWLAIVVADGAGSASHSEIGATLACDEFVRRVETLERDVLLTRVVITSLFADVRIALFAEAERLGVPPRELACTTLLAVVGPTSAAFAQLGDGAIVVGHEQGYRAVFWPEPAEYANATDFLTADQFADFIQFETTTDTISEVAVFTDGLQRLALDFASRAAHPAFFRPLFDELRNAVDTELLAAPFYNFLDSQRVNERTDDDKTLVLAIRRQ